MYAIYKVCMNIQNSFIGSDTILIVTTITIDYNLVVVKY
jgi:hypothetical protein